MSFPRYGAYKDSGVEWLGDVPTQWDVLPVKQRFRLLTGRTERRSYPVALENVEGWTGRFVETEAEFEGEGVAFERDDILFGKLRPYLAKAWVADRAGEAIGDFLVMRPAVATLSRFAAYVMLSREFIAIVDGSTFGSKMPRASWDFVASMPVAWPSINEQTSLVVLLDRETAKIDTLIAEQERLIELLKEKRQAVISQAVTKGLDPSVPMKDSGVEWLGSVPDHWRVGSIGYHLSVLTGYPFASSGFTHDESGTRLLRGVNVGVKCTRWEDSVRWNRSADDGLDGFNLLEGDLVLGMDRPLIADGIRVATISKSDLPCLLLQRVAVLRTRETLVSNYAMQLFSSGHFVAHFHPETTGVSVPHISPEQIKRFIVPIPPPEEQPGICSYIERMSVLFAESASEATAAIDLLRERRSALISAAVTGKIDVRGLVVPQPDAALA